jgi:hypothetical protein
MTGSKRCWECLWHFQADVERVFTQNWVRGNVPAWCHYILCDFLQSIPGTDNRGCWLATTSIASGGLMCRQWRRGCRRVGGARCMTCGAGGEAAEHWALAIARNLSWALHNKASCRDFCMYLLSLLWQGVSCSVPYHLHGMWNGLHALEFGDSFQCSKAVLKCWFGLGFHLQYVVYFFTFCGKCLSIECRYPAWREGLAIEMNWWVFERYEFEGFDNLSSIDISFSIF